MPKRRDKFIVVLRLWILPKSDFLHGGFDKDDLRIKILGKVVILKAAKKIEGENYESIARYKQRIYLPDNVNLDTVTTKFNTDGNLVIKARYKQR